MESLWVRERVTGPICPSLFLNPFLPRLPPLCLMQDNFTCRQGRVSGSGKALTGLICPILSSLTLSFPPRLAKTASFVILPSLMPDNFTCQGKGLMFKTVNLNTSLFQVIKHSTSVYSSELCGWITGTIT